MNGKKSPAVVMIGGGTGSFTLLSVLKDYVQDITALVNMVDSGGSSGILRDELGALPPGDVRQCLVALSRSGKTMRDLFNYRFTEGSLEGHSFGNLFISAVEKMTNNFGEAVSLAGEVLAIQGRVLPITLTDTHLVLTTKDGREVVGEEVIGNADLSHDDQPDLKLEPAAEINPEAKTAIETADLVVIAPGSLYRSLIPTLLVEGVAEALQKTPAKVIYVCNLMTDRKQTKGYSVNDFVNELERFIGEGSIDKVLYNNAPVEQELIDKYTAGGEAQVVFDSSQTAGYQAVGADLVSDVAATAVKGDFIKRTFIRHNGDAVARALMKVFYS